MGKRTSGFVKNAALIVGVLVAVKLLQNKDLLPTASGLGGALGNILSGVGNVNDLVNNAKDATGSGSGPEGGPGVEGAPINEDAPFTPVVEGPSDLNPGQIFTQQGFKGLLDSFRLPSNAIGQFKSAIRVPNLRQGLDLSVLGSSGIQSIGQPNIRGTSLLGPNAISTQRQTLVGSFTTPTGGTRIIRGSAGLFERIRSNLSL